MNDLQAEHVIYQPIGVIHTPHKSTTGMPIQPAGAEGIAGTVEVYPQYVEGLADLSGFSHIILLNALGWYQRASQRVEEARSDHRFSEEG